ncbi:hypothetical protein CDL12_22687 [Handroanthus impetiginosus]|uniref:Uncharacterized protein n=1 Tax=Handroanthus impetiginosus TaxID=429701 RepID=A0A2G9GHK4_9LAMI|nr:hypothetical protein CDL12_22687 [Handroanthus impetiginosus]
MKIANGQFMMKVKQLENVREELWTRVQFLEGELKQTTYAEESHSNPNTTYQLNHSKDFSKRDNDQTQSQVLEMDYESRTHLLEDELVKALKDNDMYKSRLESADQAATSKKSESKEAINTSKAEYKISQLEDELQDICDRYLQLSLKYAEVEAQREQLVMKLKAVSS